VNPLRATRALGIGIHAASTIQEKGPQ
jgi:hypothetical protein